MRKHLVIFVRFSGVLRDFWAHDSRSEVDNADYARDVANFMLFYLPEQPTDARALATCLPRLPASVSNTRKLCGCAARTIVAIGHSMGAHALYALVKPTRSLLESFIYKFQSLSCC